jgi:hypothetical protein
MMQQHNVAILRNQHFFLLIVVICTLLLGVVNSFHIEEHVRIAEFTMRNYTWPPQKWNPPTMGRIMDRRLRQIQAIDNRVDRFHAYSVLSSSTAIVGKNLTQFGWALTRAPQHLVDLLTQELFNKPWNARESEEYLHPMGLRILDQLPFMVDTTNVNQYLLRELQPLHEQWINQPLQPVTAFGMRVYQNQSQLLMHVDTPKTHIVSSILHIASSEDAEDWPLLVQDYEGNVIEVHMTPGDLVFYESSRILHGRPSVFRGSWYTSLFLHYMPINYWKDHENPKNEMFYAIPPDWDKDTIPLDPSLPALSVLGMGMEEPSCPGGWCGTDQPHKEVRGPAIGPGILESTRGVRYLPQDDTFHSHDEL